MRHAQSYLLWTPAWSLLLSVLIVVLNGAIDPYAVIGSPRLAGFNQLKPAINARVRLSKQYQPFRQEIDTLIVGNSRVEMGLNPEHVCLQNSGYDTYNLGLPGASVGYQTAAALNVIYQQGVSRVFLGVDFTDFLIHGNNLDLPSRVGSTVIDNARYQPDGTLNPDYPWQRFQDYYRVLYSLDAFIDSLGTPLRQGPYAPNRTERGFNPAHDYLGATLTEGARALFQQKEAELEEKYRQTWRLYHADGSRSADFDDLERFLTIALEQDIEVIMFSNPLHQRFWRIMDAVKLRDTYRQWQMEMLKLIDSLPAGAVAFWDFTADSSYLHEPLPEASDPRRLKWFWEPAHYTEALGDVMLQDMLSASCDAPVTLGTRLRPAASAAVPPAQHLSGDAGE